MKYVRHLTTLLFIVLIAVSGCKKDTVPAPLPVLPPTPPGQVVIQAPPSFGFYVVGYFPSYRNLGEVPDVKFRMCNVVNYAFFAVNPGGMLTINNPALVPQVITKARANKAKVFVSINDGSGDGKTNFINMAASPSGRNIFIKDVMDKVRQYTFDGVDIDWEFPRTDDGTDITFTAFIKELSDSLHRDAKYYLSIAIIAGKFAGPTRDAIKAEIFGYADFFNVMSYDDFSLTTPYKNHSDYNLSVTSLNYWLTTRGMPKEKCVLGFPAYGRASGLAQTGTTLPYRTILSQGGSSQKDSAVITSNPSYPAGYTIYYNGQPTVKLKTILAKQKANGVMMWEKWNDAPDANSLLKAACDTIGRAY
ncbi:MAG: glycoside hydrolase family 18 protein [Ferruginibacter sp.]